MDFETVERNVGDIVKSDDSIEGKVKKLIEQASVLKGSCQWSVGKEQSGLGAEQFDGLSDESLENRKVLIEQHGEKFPFEYFELLFDEEFREHFCDETMRYAVSKGDHQFRIADDDLKKFVCVLLLSGYHQVPEISLNWDTKIDMSVGIVRNAISKNRLKEINKYFHCADNDNLDVEDKFSNICPLFDVMNSKLNQFGYMHNKFSIQTNGSVYRYAQCKADDTYKVDQVWIQELLVNVIGWIPILLCSICWSKGSRHGKDLTARITLQLALQLSTFSTNELFFDNWFPSYKLIALFSAMGLAGTATIQNGKLNHCPLISDSRLKKEDRGTFREVYDKTSKLVAVKWNDNSIVKLISNVYASEPTSNATRYSRKDSMKISIQKPNIVT